MLLAMLAAHPAPQKLPESVTLSYGIGRDSCAHWLGVPGEDRDGVNWLFGYWTALNFLNPNTHLVGAKAGPSGVVDEVRKLCQAQPSMPLQSAVGGVYGQMLRAGK